MDDYFRVKIYLLNKKDANTVISHPKYLSWCHEDERNEAKHVLW